MPAVESVLPELRAMWWESGARTRAQVGMFAVFAELPRLLAAAVRLSWRADRGRTILVGVATLGAGVLAAFGLLATRRVLVELFAAGPTPQRVTAALPALAVLAVVTGLRAGLGIASGYAQNGLTPRVDREVERALFEVTTAVRLDAFDADAFADDMERASRGTDSAVGLVQGVMNLLAGLAGLLAVAAAVIIIHPLLLLALLVATLPNAWASLRAGHQRYQTFIAGSVRRRRLWLLHRLMAERDSAAELRSYGLRRFLLDQYDRVMGAETDIQLTLARKVTTTTSVGSAIGGIATAGVYTLLGLLLLDGRIPIAAAATCVIAVQTAQRSLTTVTLQMDRIYTDGQHFSDYTGFMTRAAHYLPTHGDTAVSAASNDSEVDVRPAAATLRRLDVQAVTFAYPDRDTPAVDDVTLTIHAGQTVAFVGENGSGKSSLAAMIAALRLPDAGTISWNGEPFDAWNPATLRARIAVVTQDYHKFPFTAATNIAIGDSDAEPDQQRIETAAARAAAHDMIIELPHGYETLLDRTFANGQDLSGGQWQRITAARGFLRTADLLIMDEPSSALDPRAEDALFQAIRDRQGTHTTILITHRLANVRHADHIYVLHHGRIVEHGTHDTLTTTTTGGRYAELFTMQAAGYLEAAPPAGEPR
ncbi:ATP-binding cassette domain-containing protein [Dactylosporangium sp. NPDC051485]|uniref:ATP-binding cassette domain-containing protein n=1 Tax=Dactylosporangium sp. NPDC051485 TaxID=3154846 RepID=UPI00341788A1